MKFDEFNKILKHINTLSWKCEIQDEEIYSIAKNIFSDISFNATKNKSYYRLIGQSGSGKTTQLLPAVENLCKNKSINAIHFAVRNFAIYHPNYNNLLAKYGKSEIREKTNGFALKCLFFCLVFAIENNFDILLEVTLLTKRFESFILCFLKIYEYSRFYFAISANQKISNYFIKERQENNTIAESGRKVNNISASFFYKNLHKSLNYLIKKDAFSNIIIWNIYDFLPIYDGKIKNCKKIFSKNSKIVSYCFKDINMLSTEKINYLRLK